MAAARYDFIIDQGATFSRDLVIKSDATTLKNITGWTPLAVIKQTYADVSPVITITTSVITVGSIIKMGLTAAQTEGLAAGKYVYDLQVTLPDTTVLKLITGVIQVNPGVS